MFRQPRLKLETFVLSTRVDKPMANDILREAKKRKSRVSVEVRRRLNFYTAAHTKAPEQITTAE